MGYYKALWGKGEGNMIEKKATIDGKEYTFRSSALLPRLYRAKFRRDLVRDMRQLMKAYKAADGDEEAFLDVADLEVFENVAWIMLHYAGEDVGDSPEEWLNALDGVFSAYAAMPVIIELWAKEQKTTSVPKKK